jgi:hypothetical protein
VSDPGPCNCEQALALKRKLLHEATYYFVHALEVMPQGNEYDDIEEFLAYYNKWRNER